MPSSGNQKKRFLYREKFCLVTDWPDWAFWNNLNVQKDCSMAEEKPATETTHLLAEHENPLEGPGELELVGEDPLVGELDKDEVDQPIEEARDEGPDPTDKTRDTALGSTEWAKALNAMAMKQGDVMHEEEFDELEKQEVQRERNARAKLLKFKDAHKLPEKTTLYQRRIRSCDEAPSAFARVDANRVPLVLLPDDRHPCSLFFMVPSGMYTVKHVFGKPAPTFAKEGKNYALSCCRVAYCVSRQACTYSAPVRQCPTFDNVMIDITIKVIFQIGDRPEEVQKFVYYLGASRFDEFLYVSVQEAVRTMIRASYCTEARSLFGSDHPGVKATLEGLNHTFNRFGVHFLSAAITDVYFSNPELAETLQEVTAFQSKVTEHSEAHVYREVTCAYMRDRSLLAIGSIHERAVMDAKHAQKCLQAQRKIIMEDLERERQVKLIETQSTAEMLLIQKQMEADIAVQNATEEMQAALKDAEDWSKVTLTSQEGTNAALKAETEAYVAQHLAQAKETMAEAENKARKLLRQQREHELELRRNATLSALAQDKQVVVSGRHGEKLLDALVHGLDSFEFDSDDDSAPSRRAKPDTTPKRESSPQKQAITPSELEARRAKLRQRQEDLLKRKEALRQKKEAAPVKSSSSSSARITTPTNTMIHSNKQILEQYYGNTSALV
eukprot:g13856.t1